MKNIGLILCMVCSLAWSCEESTDPPAVPAPEQLRAKQEQVWVVPATDFEDSFGWAAGFLDTSKSLHVSYQKDADTFTITEVPVGPPGITVVCQRDGVSFVRRVKDYLENHPGDCLCICVDEDGYEATNGC